MWPRDPLDLLARGQFTCSENPQIPAALAVFNHLLRQINNLPAAAHFPARLPRLRNFEEHLAGLPTVANADAAFIEPHYRQILAEAAKRHVGQTELGAPVRVVVG